MTFTLRSITHADLPFMCEMLYQSIFADPPLPRSILEAPEFRHYIADWGRPHDAGFLAMNADANPIGAAWIRLFTHDDPGFGYVDNDTPEVSTLAVVPEWRRKGIGMALMQALLSHADLHYAQVSLSCDPNNPAMHLYRQLGFAYWGINGGSHTLLRQRHRRSNDK